MGIAWGVGTAGGNQARKEGALEWPERLSAREAQVAATLEALGPEKEERDGWGLRDELDLLRAVKPAVSALSALARLVVDDRPLADIAPAFLDFLEKWVLDPGSGAPVHSLLRDELDGAGADEVARSVGGADALAVIEERIASMRLPTVRFGKPAVYVGTLSGAAGLEFEAVRILGLAEGALPSAVREDAVLPDRMRKEAGPLVPLSSDRVTAQLHSFDRAVRSARSRIALSVPHSDLERSDRETSSLLIEVGAALGRPDGKERPVIPDLQSLRRTSFEPARDAAAAFRAAHPVTEVQWLDRATATNEIPPAWKEGRQLALSRILALRDHEGLDAADGILGSEGPFPVFPGMAPERPISASALEALLGCPLRFLFDRVLKWKEPAGPSSVRELDALTYGSLLHVVAERFYGEHGADFVARKGTLAAWKKKARAVAAEEFDALRVSQPLVGLGVEEKERNRLFRDLDSFLGYDWGLKLDRFVGVELAFDGLTIDAGRRQAERPRLHRPHRRGGWPRARPRPQVGQGPPARGQGGGPDPDPRRPARPLLARGPEDGEGVEAAREAPGGLRLPSQRRRARVPRRPRRAGAGDEGVARRRPRAPRRALLPALPFEGRLQVLPLPRRLRRPGPRARRRRGGRGRRGRLLLAQGGTEGGERKMSANALPPPPDEKHRLAAVASRGENLLVDAGAGTGKTTLLVRRLVEMVAPSNDAAPAISLDRIAAVTFTRKAAGELKLRVREKLLSELARKPSAARRDRLAAALTAADTAFIGTIHGFADRLLRRRPVEARLSPSYEVLEDTTALVHETFETLLQASEAGTLADELADTDVDPAVASEAGESIRLALQAEVQVETKEFDFSSSHGLDALFAAFIAHRDVPPVQGKAAPFPAARVKQKIDEFLEVARQSNGTGKGSKFLKRFADRLEAISEELDPVALYREVNAAMRWKPQKMRLKDEFVGDGPATTPGGPGTGTSRRARERRSEVVRLRRRASSVRPSAGSRPGSSAPSPPSSPSTAR